MFYSKWVWKKSWVLDPKICTNPAIRFLRSQYQSLDENNLTYDWQDRPPHQWFAIRLIYTKVMASVPEGVTLAQMNTLWKPLAMRLEATQWRIQGRGPGSPLFVGQIEKRRAEKNFFAPTPPPPPTCYLKVWIRHYSTVPLDNFCTFLCAVSHYTTTTKST